MRWEYTQKATIFFKQMAVARSIFTLGGQVQLFWTAFDLIFIVVPLKVTLWWHKFYFWAFKKNNDASGCPWLFFETQKKHLFLYSNENFNGTPVTGISKAVQNNWTCPPKVNIERGTAICLKKNLKKKQIVAFWV